MVASVGLAGPTLPAYAGLRWGVSLRLRAVSSRVRARPSPHPPHHPAGRAMVGRPRSIWVDLGVRVVENGQAGIAGASPCACVRPSLPRRAVGVGVVGWVGWGGRRRRPGSQGLGRGRRASAGPKGGREHDRGPGGGVGCTPGGKARIRDSARGARGGVRVLHRRSICLCGFAGVPPRGGRGGVEMERDS